MRVIIEDYQYDASKVDKVLWEGAFQTVDGLVSIGYVGYYWNDRLKDAVFFLPKVLVDEKDLVFRKYRPEDIIHIENSPLEKDEKDFLYGFAVWIYRTLVVYKKSHSDSKIILHEFVSQAGRGKKRLSNTFLDVILSLVDFLRRNRDFVMFTAKVRHSGFNKVSWPKTVAKKSPVFDGAGVPVYAQAVNRKKEVDREEELLVIFHSILFYIAKTYGFDVKPDLNYELITGAKFKRYLAGFGRARLRAIKYRYFSDKLLELWDLCYVFFDHSHSISLTSVRKEYLLAKDFNIVFEAIIDELVGEPRENLPNGLKDQEDGKIVDHMFSHQSLTNNDERDHKVYYIGDSKYYKCGNKVGLESVAKQFTYARNVIQWNLNIFLDNLPQDEADRRRFPKLRDDVTEGYNVIPNFFISARMNEKLIYDEGDISRRADVKLQSRQFENRLFDRDTLLVAHYDINFLFIVALYARNNFASKEAWKERMRAKFQRDIQEMLEERFVFYAMTPLSGTDPEEFFKTHFQQLLGKVFTPYNDTHEQTVYYSLALLNHERADYAFAKEENEAVLECIGEAFEYKICPLGVNPASCGLTPHSPAPHVTCAADKRTRHFVENYLDDFFLFGCIKNEAHREWIFSRAGKLKRNDVYNVRLGSRPGAVRKAHKEVRTPKFIIMYNQDDDSKYIVYRVRGSQVWTKERMLSSGYDAPHGAYFCYVLDEEVSLGALNVSAIRRKYKYLIDPRHPFSPLYISGKQLLAAGE
ncbi:MAG: restriction endonuclease [Kiritimatiellae bacterium]|nr:restriction endonuclease [Kiritimatiellia bacterium]